MGEGQHNREGADASEAVKRPVAVDLFAGAGGLSLGFEQAGFDVLSAVEYDAIHAAVHRFNFPRCDVVCADASTVTADKLRRSVAAGAALHGTDWSNEIDVVIGGPPCQGFSTGGKRAFDDPRNQLVREFVRLVGALKPRYFVMENVPGMASVAAGPDADPTRLIDLAIEELEAFGYTVAPPRALNAAEFGVPQERRRLIVLGARESSEMPEWPAAATRPRARSGETNDISSEEGGLDLCPSVDDAIGDLPDLDRWATLLLSDQKTLTDAALAGSEARASSYARMLRGLETDAGDLSWPRIWDRAVITSSLRTTHDAATAERFRATDPGTREPISRFFRLHAAGAAPTLRAGTGYERGSFNAPRPIHFRRPRVISVREAARLHAYPDWFRFNWTKWHGFRQVGNSLPPPVGRAIGSRLVARAQLHTIKPTIAIPLGDPDLLYLGTVAAAERMNADLERAPRHALRTRRKAAA